MVKIRLQRYGKKKHPFYRVVAADHRYRRDGRFIEQVGTYNPDLETNAVQLKEERVSYWLEKGAVPTVTVMSLLKKKGLVKSK